MRTVLLRTAGLLQSWGTESRFERRGTGDEPSKSGVLGMIAAALGIPRADDGRLATLTACWMGCRAEREGRRLTDFQTVGGGVGRDRVRGAAEAVLTTRDYLSGSCFLVALGFDDAALAEAIDAALGDPYWVTYLGRKSCAPSIPVRAGLVNADPETALREAPWPYEERPDEPVRLVLEAPYGVGEWRQDVPVSFEPLRRAYERRWVRTDWIQPSDLLLPGEQPKPKEHATAWARPAARSSGRDIARAGTPPILGLPTGRGAISGHVFLTRIFLNAMSPDVKRDLDDTHATHRRVMDGFPVVAGCKDARARNGVLYRLERDADAGLLILWVQSTIEPNWRNLPKGYLQDLLGSIANPAMTVLSWPQLKAADEYAFSLRATASCMKAFAGTVREKVALMNWLERQAALKVGVEVFDVRVQPEGELRGFRPEPSGPPRKQTFWSALFSGRLRVRDPEMLRLTLRRGIGDALPYGFGLLTLSGSSAPVSSGFAQVGTPQVGTPQVGTPQVGTPQVGTPQVGTGRYSKTRCTICRRSDRSDIETALCAGEPVKSVARRFGVPRSTMQGHAKHPKDQCVPS